MRLRLSASLSLLGCLSVALWGLPHLQPCRAVEPWSGEREVDKRIAQLASDEFDVREAAARWLTEHEEAIPALRQASKSRDAEVVRRARDILDAIARRAKERPFRQLAESAKRGAVDQAAQRLVLRDKWDDEGVCWQTVADLADRIMELERKSYGKVALQATDGVSPESLVKCAVALGFRPNDPAGSHSPQWWKGRVVLRAENISASATALNGLVVLSGDSVRMLRATRSTLFFTGQAVAIEGVNQSLIVCDGDFTAGSDVRDSLIIARGKVRCRGSASNSLIIAGGEVRFTHPEQAGSTKVVEKEPKPLGFIKFFDPADVGITVESAEGGARVKSAEKGKPFAAAGVRADDLITQVNGQAVKDAESFRRLLRASLAVDGDTVLKVRRDKQVSEVRVPAPDSPRKE